MALAEQLAHCAARASNRPTFLGYQIAAYQRTHGLTDELLAAELGILPERLANLRLCGRVRVEDAAQCADDIRVIAAHIGCDPRALARIVLG